MVRKKNYRWHYLAENRAQAQALQSAQGLRPAVARVLANRGFSAGSTSLGEYLQPVLGSLHDPFLLRDMDPAVARILDGIARRENITIFGDYDVDGITATALLVRTFRHLGLPVRTYIPHRLEEGYGMRGSALEKIAADGTTLVVTVDNGITAFEQVDQARALGMDVVVTDHHQPGERLPSALAVVNPNRRDCAYPNKHLAGVGVAFKLAHALLKRSGSDPAASLDFLRSVLDLVAIGTVADVAPLLGENRAMVKHGLQRVRTTGNIGITAIRRAAGMDDPSMSAEKVGFQIAPRLNAAGRTDHAQVCVDLLTTDDETLAADIAGRLEVFNRERRSVETRIFEESLAFVRQRVDLAQERVLVVDGPGWHIGVIGIVASRLLDLYDRPVIILSHNDGNAKGSARSIDGFNIHDALESCAGLLDGFGGHPGAAGLQLRESRIPALRAAINDYAAGRLQSDDLQPSLTIDTELDPGELDESLLADLGRLEPFGQSNPQPVFSLRGLMLADQPRVVGTNHLRLALRAEGGRPWGAIGFGMGNRAGELAQTQSVRLDVAFVPVLNTFNGQTRVEMRVRDLKPRSGQ